jgi:hypothetical protein|tara:strand:- start:388 stop:579 length:192 start_codon:yes stop_codon:yes gene_type:complete
MGGTTTGLDAITTAGEDAHADNNSTKQLNNNLLANSTHSKPRKIIRNINIFAAIHNKNNRRTA